MTEHDYTEYKDGPGDNMLAAIVGLARDQKAAELEVARLETDLKKAKERLVDISEHQLPDLMDKAELGDFTTKEGITIEIDERIRASIAKQDLKRQAAAFNWLESNGHEGLIKRQFVIEFNRDDERWANKFERDLRQRKKPLNVKRKKEVHSSTLVSFVKEQLGQGVQIPLKTFGVMRQRFAKVGTKE